MSKSILRSLAPLLLAVIGVAASAPVAMRVEMAVLQELDGDTLVALTLQVAPEDRSRIGANAMVETELMHGAVDVAPQLWAVKLEDDGSARIEIAWPPGEYELRVTIASPSGSDSGLWVGKVNIPRFGKPAPAVVAAPPASTPEPQLDLEDTVAAPIEKTPEPSPEPAPEPEPVVVAAGASVAAAAGRELDQQPPSTEAVTEPSAGREQAEASREPVPDTTEVATSPEPAPEPTEVTTSSEPVPEPSTEVVTDEAPIAAAEEISVEVPEAETTEPEPLVAPAVEPAPQPLVQPLRDETVVRTAEPQAEAAIVAAIPETFSADLESPFSEWDSAGPETMDVTAIITENRESAQGLRGSDLRLRVDGNEVPIEDLGDAAQAPLLLGFATDVSPRLAGDAARIGRLLGPLTGRVNGGRGKLFVTALGDPVGKDGGWGVDPLRVAESLQPTADGDLARLITESLARFEGQRGRGFLLVLTDGRNEPSKAMWQEASLAVGNAGIPVLVIALWDSEFKGKTRKNLQRVTGDSGGSLFLVQGIDQLGGVVERYGRLLDAGVAVRFQAPESAKGSPRAISLIATDRTLDVSIPKTVR
jgi:hypothetical protein